MGRHTTAREQIVNNVGKLRVLRALLQLRLLLPHIGTGVLKEYMIVSDVR